LKNFETGDLTVVSREGLYKIAGDMEICSLEMNSRYNVVNPVTQFKDENVVDLFVDEVYIQIFSYIEKKEVVKMKKVCKTFYRKINNFHNNCVGYRDNAYTSIVKGNEIKCEIDSGNCTLKNTVFSFVIESFIETSSYCPDHVSSFRMKCCTSTDAYFLMMAYLSFIQMSGGSSRYYYYLDIYCQALKDKWKWLMYVLFGSRKEDANSYFFNAMDGRRFGANETQLEIRDVFCKYSVKRKKIIMEKYGMYEMFDTFVLDTGPRMPYKQSKNCCTVCSTRKIRSDEMRIKFKFPFMILKGQILDKEIYFKK